MSSTTSGAPQGPPPSGSSKFSVYITGTLESTTLRGYDNVHANFFFTKGEGWSFISGIESGGTQLAAKATSGPNRFTFVWNFPIELMYNALSPSGWPQIVVAVYGQDLFGRDILVGTGSVHVPIGPGTFESIIPLFKPKSSSFLQKCVAFFTGAYPEFVDKNFPALTQTRYIARTESSGIVRCVFNVVVRNMHVAGYSVSGEEYSL